MRIKHKAPKAGDVFKINKGGTATVVQYRDSGHVLIEHNDDHKHRAVVTAQSVRLGSVKNPFRPSVYTTGYIGVGEHRSFVGRKMSPAYDAWVRMLQRCYDSNFHIENPTYIGCSTHSDWFNFQSFAKWFFSQQNSGKAGFQLDKDLRVIGNKFYSADTCSIVPDKINALIIDSGAARGKYPQGVSAHRCGFQANVKINCKQVYLGVYSTPEQAYAVYKKAKEENVKSVATEWKDWIHPDVYKNLMEWTL